MTYVIVAAAEFEAQGLLTDFREAKIDCELAITGVGCLNAAKSARKLAEQCAGKDVLFVGSCGCFTDFKKPYLVTSQEVVWSPIGERAKLAYTVKDSAPKISLAAPLPWLKSLPVKSVICAPTISLQAIGHSQILPEESVENLELYSCAAEIAAGSKTFTIILAITNALNADAHRHWLQNFKRGAELTRKFVRENLLRV